MTQTFRTFVQRVLPESFLRANRIRRYKRILPDDLCQIIERLPQDAVCVDCGANIGRVSEVFAAQGAIVHAFEPNPHAFRHLQAVSVAQPRIRAFNKAVGTSDDERLDLYLHDLHDEDPLGYSQGSSLLSDKPNVSAKAVSVQMVDLSRHLKELDRVAILKIDIEGYEVELLPHLLDKGALDKVDQIFIETHEKKWPALREKTEHMIQLVEDSSAAGRVRYDWP